MRTAPIFGPIPVLFISVRILPLRTGIQPIQSRNQRIHRAVPFTKMLRAPKCVRAKRRPSREVNLIGVAPLLSWFSPDSPRMKRSAKPTSNLLRRRMIPVEQRDPPSARQLICVNWHSPIAYILEVLLCNLKHMRIDIHIRKVLKHIRRIIQRTGVHNPYIQGTHQNYQFLHYLRNPLISCHFSPRSMSIATSIPSCAMYPSGILSPTHKQGKLLSFPVVEFKPRTRNVTNNCTYHFPSLHLSLLAILFNFLHDLATRKLPNNASWAESEKKSA